MILAVDIGATKVRIALAEADHSSVRLVESARFETRDWEHLLPLVEHFLSETRVSQISAAAFGVAGPVTDDPLLLTNLQWEIDLDEIRTTLKCLNIYAVNDLAAHAYGVALLKEDGIKTVQSGKRRQGNLGVIGAGTGLGESLVALHRDDVIPIASEGGHSDFSPRDEFEIALFRFLKKRYGGGHVSWERIVSGKYGFRNLYDFLVQSGIPHDPLLHSELGNKEEIGKNISEAARNGVSIAREVMQRFMSCYGAEAGNLALKGLTMGGMFIIGGIARRNLDFLCEGHFLTSFVSKGRFSDLLREIPIHVVTDAELPVKGLAFHAWKKSQSG